MHLHDKVAVVTGASSGIGEAIARELSRAGARLVITARRQDRLSALSASLDGASAMLCAPIDNPQTPKKLLDLAVSTFGRKSSTGCARAARRCAPTRQRLWHQPTSPTPCASCSSNPATPT